MICAVLEVDGVAGSLMESPALTWRRWGVWGGLLRSFQRYGLSAELGEGVECQVAKEVGARTELWSPAENLLVRGKMA